MLPISIDTAGNVFWLSESFLAHYFNNFLSEVLPLGRTISLTLIKCTMHKLLKPYLTCVPAHYRKPRHKIVKCKILYFQVRSILLCASNFLPRLFCDISQMSIHCGLWLYQPCLQLYWLSAPLYWPTLLAINRCNKQSYLRPSRDNCFSYTPLSVMSNIHLVSQPPPVRITHQSST